jgi:ELMO domain-containing protein
MQDSFHRLLHKADGKRAEWEYPFAVGGVNISYMLVQMLDLQSGDRMPKIFQYHSDSFSLRPAFRL